jgi:hypothetical protein
MDKHELIEEARKYGIKEPEETDCPDCLGTGKTFVDTGDQPLCTCVYGDRRRLADDIR